MGFSDELVRDYVSIELEKKWKQEQATGRQMERQ